MQGFSFIFPLLLRQKAAILLRFHRSCSARTESRPQFRTSKWDNQGLFLLSFVVIDCNGNSQCHADYSGHIGYQATRRDLRTLHNENMPGSVHQYVQSDRNPYVEIPLDVHPAEIECADEGYTESGERRKGIVSLIEMYGAKVEGRQYDSPEESCFAYRKSKPNISARNTSSSLNPVRMHRS